jgi:hypothetical protein
MLAAATLLIAFAGVAQNVALAVVECLAGVGLLAMAARMDRQSPFRMLPSQTLDLRHPVGTGLLTVFALSMAKTGFWAYGPLILKTMFGIDPLISGYILAGESLAWSFATVAVSNAPASSTRMLIRIGVGLIVVGTGGLAVTVPAGSIGGIIVCELLGGAGFGIAWPSIVRRIVPFADDSERTLAAGAPGTVQRIAFAVGAATTGIAANMSGLADGMSIEAARAAGFWVFASFIPVLRVGGWAAWRFTASEDVSLQRRS